jgi:hypothetical protein
VSPADARRSTRGAPDIVLGLMAVGVLAWGALPYLPGQIDDAYIVFAYAHRVVEHGEVAWNTGERVEGYSSPVHLLCMVVGCLVGLDLSVFARALSFVAAVAAVLLLLRPCFGPGRGWLALFVAAWQPFQHWAVAGLETSLATLLGLAGWSMLFAGRGAWAVGCAILAAFSLTRPEGAAWLGAGILLRARYPRGFGGPEAAVIGTLAGLSAYHAARLAYFGALFPTPWLVKIVAIEHFAAGAKEASWELLSASPLLVLVLLFRRSISIWVWFPLALQAALLVRAGGDWMGNARFLLPGLVAAVGAAFVAGKPRDVRWIFPAALLPFAAMAFAWEPAQMQGQGPKWRDTWFLRRPLAALGAPWSVPLLDEVAFLVRRVPVGAGVEMSDVGLPGNLEDIRIWDGAGLTDRVVAEIIAGTETAMSPALLARFDDPDDIWCVRYGGDVDGSDPADPWMKAMFSEVATKPDARGLFWRCRPGGAVADSVVAERWRRLLSRFPAQDEIRRQYARAQLAAGEPEGAVETARGATWVRGDADGWLLFDAPSGAAYSPSRGWPMYANGVLETPSMSAPFWTDRDVHLDVDDPGPEGALVSLRWEPPCGTAVSMNVLGATASELPACESSTPRALVVEFQNDEWRPDFDRNVFVTLVGTNTTPARR